MKQIHSIFTKSLLVVMLTMTTQTAWADDLTSANLQIDSEIAAGTAGYYYYNMPGYTQGNTVHHTLTISEQDITDGKATFKVYDNGGKDGNYGYTIRAYLTITAPEGKVVKVNGTVITYTDGSWGDFMYIYDGADNTVPKIRNGDSEKFCSQQNKSAVDVQSSNNSITLYFETDGQSGTIAAGLDLTVEINDPTYDIRKAAVTGIQSEYSYTGSVIPINYSVHAYSTNELLTKGTHYTETITKGDEAADVIEEGDYTVTITGKSPYYGSQSFDFTVWKSLTQDGSEWYITIPTKRKRTLTITQADIAAGITAFKVYEAGGKESVLGKNWDGVLVVNVPEGYFIQLSGVVQAATYTNNELTIDGILTVYDNNEASGTMLLENTNLVYDNYYNASATIPSNVISTGQNMAIRYQVENDYTDIDLTATLIPDDREFNITVSNSITGGSVTSNLSQAKGNDEVPLTVTPDEGYMLNELTVTDADGGTVNVTDCNWYTDWSNKTSKTATFSMPTKAVTVAATFTNILSSADGGLYVNMPHAGTKNVIIPDNIISFKLYDDGGKDGVFQCYSNGIVVITAPSGKLLQISGKSFLTNSLVSGHSNYAICNGTPENSGEQMAYNNQEQEVTLSPVVSEGNTIYVSFSASDNNDPDDNKYGLDMTVEVITPDVYNISIDNGIEHGSVSLDKTQATNNEIVNVTVTPDEGYVLKEISVSDAGGAISMTKPTTDQWGDAVYYTATNGYSFKMRSSDATVTATFMPKTDFYVNMPKTDQRDFTIPDGTTSFKVYDNSGKNGYYVTNDNGKLLLTAPEGYVMNVSGYVKLYYSSDDQDYLDIYDGNSTSATSLGRFKDTSGNNNTFTQTSVNTISSTNQMLLHFVTNDYGYAPGGGVYLTVTLVPKEYSITYNGVDGATFATANPATYTIESGAINLNNPTREGYAFAGWTGTGLDAATTTVTIAQGSTGDRSYTATWKRPLTNADITVTAIEDQVWTGSAIEPAVAVTDGTTDITDQCTIVYSDNTATGTATVTITAKAASATYCGETSTTFNILPKTVTVKNNQNEDVPAATGDATITQDENGTTLTLITPTGTDAPQTVNIPQAVEVDHVNIQRTYVSGKASTVYLPFSIEVSKLSSGTFHTFTNVDQTTSPWTVNYSVALAQTATLEANTPYLFMPDGTNEGKIVLNNGSDKVSVCTANPHTTTQGQWEFIGTYEPIVWASEHTDLGKVYGFAAVDKEVSGKNITAGQFVKAAAGASIAPMRAYLKYTPVQAAPARGMNRGASAEDLPATMRVVIAGANGETTEVGTISIEQNSGDWYTIDGRKLSGKPMKKGLYIHNGQKTVIK